VNESASVRSPHETRPERQFAMFCLVGGIGFVVDAGLLWLLLNVTDLGPLIARLLSYLAAVTTTWLLHRRLTFPVAGCERKARQWVLFVVVNGAGAALNYGVYALLVLFVGVFAEHPVAAVAVGSAVALLVNFWANRTWVFRVATP